MNTTYSPASRPVARMLASAVAVGVTFTIFTAVVSQAMQTQADGSVRLAHAGTPQPAIAAEVVVALADRHH